ncbi:hypothetical protein Golax_014673 [Gossypium laxum]|uniref:RRM domain-containing protein n=1 Tax=Gossypium laxum TaxID=34288 RepID=A0A7J8ZVS2_9ROSI|nr:hypothetical protein [Gossypium laxum]
MSQGGYGAYNAYISAATRYAAVGAPTLYDHPGPMYGIGGESSRGMGKKIFVGRLPQEATADDLRQYFGRFGRVIDVYVPKDPKRSGHRGFGFVTFAEDGVADRVSRRSHEICGQQVAIDSATPVDDAGPSFMMNPAGPFRGFGGPMRPFGRMYGGLPYDDVMGLCNWEWEAIESRLAVQAILKDGVGKSKVSLLKLKLSEVYFLIQLSISFIQIINHIAWSLSFQCVGNIPVEVSN